jgi:2-desacetyl-2-hydroxyethyl bacteriochlorophyllide A dehydrogenase
VRALVYLGPHRMELQDLPVPDPGPEEVRVRVATAAICGSDLHGFREASPRRIPPLVMGHEVVGRVEAVGEAADPSLAGERVVVMPVVSCGRCERCVEGRENLCPDRRLMGMNFPGGFAETFTIPAAQLLRMPEGLQDATGSLVEPFANSIHCVDRSVRPGDDVLVIGAGPIGLLAVRAAVLAGAARTFVVDTLPGRLELAVAQGGEPVRAEGAAEAIALATDGKGVDVVIDAAGFASTWELAMKAVRWGGRVEVIGLGSVEGPISYHAVVSKGVTIAGSYACVRRDFDRALKLLSDGSADVGSWITQMPLADGQAAFEALVDGGRFTKVVLVP